MKTAEVIYNKAVARLIAEGSENMPSVMIYYIRLAQTEAYNQAIEDTRIKLSEEEQAVMDSINWPIANLHKHVYFHLTEEGQLLFNNATIKLLNATFKK